MVAEFEKRFAEYLGVKHAIAVSSGSSALLVALLASGVGLGDEVITQNRAWISVAHAIRLLGAQPVLVDVDRDVQVMNIEGLDDLITMKTKAVVPVHMNGYPPDMEKLSHICRRRGIALIEDSAQALGSSFKGVALGTFGTVSCFSFSMAKLLSSGQGGMLVTMNDDFARVARNMRTHGVESTFDPSR